MADDPFSGANPGQATAPSTTPDQISGQGATDGIQPMSLSQAMAPKAVPLSQAMGAPQSLSLSQAMGQAPSQPKSYAGSLVTGQTPLASPQTGGGMGSMTPPSLDQLPGGSAVKQVMGALDTISYPVRAHMLTEVAGAAAIGVPGAQELYQKLDPDGKLFPNPHYHDVSDFVVDKALTGAGINPDPSTQWGYFARGVIGMTKAGIGAVADMVKDPAMYMGAGELTEGAQALQKVGEVDTAASQAKNILTMKAPFSGGATGVLLSGEQAKAGINSAADLLSTRSMPISDATMSASQKVASIPGQIVRALSPNTGLPDVDQAMNTWQSLNRGNGVSGYINDVKTMNYTSDELKMVGEIGENVPNLKPNIPDSVLGASSSKFATEAEIREAAGNAIDAANKKLKIPIADGRDQAIIDGVVKAKMSDARDLENKFQAGQFNPEDVLENHLPHVMDPKYIGNSDAERAQQWAMSQEKKITSGNITKQRSLIGTVTDINSEIKNKFGIDKLFLEDPFAATAVREARSQKLLRDTNLIQSIQKYGMPAGDEARKAGYLPINHPDLAENALVYPPEISTKVGYMIGAKSPGNVQGAVGDMFKHLQQGPIGQQNRLIRLQTFTAPGIWARNALDNIVKGVVYGVGSDAWKAVRDINGGAYKGEMSAGNLLNPKGKFWSGADIQAMFDKYGVGGGTSFREGMSDYLGAAKQAIWQGGVAGYAAKASEWANGAMNFVSKYGEKAESFTRKAFMYQKVVKEGYEPAAAADLMTRVMFDYTRNAPMTDAARFFSPFIQHPIKTALAAPMLIGKNPGVYNAIHNTFPAVLANAMSDPMHQQMFNQLVPSYVRAQDPIAGPVIGSDSWLANIFGKGGPGGTQTYLTPGVGMSILNHLTNPGINPTFQGLINFVRGRMPDTVDNGVTLKGQDIPGSQKWNSLLWTSLGGSIAMPNVEKSLKQAFGLGNPQLYEPQTVYAMRAATSQFGGGIDLDHDAHVKLISLGYAYKDLQASGAKQLSLEKSGLGDPSSYSTYVRQQYGPILPATNAEIYADTQRKIGMGENQIRGEQQKTALAQQFADNQLDAGGYASRLKNIEENIKGVNQALQFSYNRYLQISSGSKPGADARQAAGVKLNATVNQMSR